MAVETSLSSQIHLARTEILNKIIEYAQTYLELENVDLTKGSFLSFLVNILSTLTSNLLFYQSSVYKEFFLTKAQLPETVWNLAGFIGYTPSEAQYAVADILITVPLLFTSSSIEFTIPNGTTSTSGGRFYADSIEFRTYYQTDITVTNNSSVEVKITENGRVYYFPVTINLTDDIPYFQFVLPVRQYKVVEKSFGVDEDIEPYQFVDINVPIDNQVSSMEVYVVPSTITPEDWDAMNTTSRQTYLYTEKTSLYVMNNDTKGFVTKPASGGVILYFGNGLLGVQPSGGSKIKITMYETSGEDGNVVAGSIIKGDTLYTSVGGVAQVVKYEVTNPSPAYNGSDKESLTEIRNNAIDNLTALRRLVTESDYQSADSIITDAPLTGNSIPVLKRSDIKNSEIQLFTTLSFSDPSTNNTTVPTSNVQYTVDSSTTYISRGTQITDDGFTYYTIFDITIDTINGSAYYHYILDNISQIPVLNNSLVCVAGGDDGYNFYADNLEVSSSDTTAIFVISYHTQESDVTGLACQMSILSNSALYNMTNVADVNGGQFTLDITPYTNIPEGEQTYKFTFSKSGSFISEYSATITFRRNLNAFMMSNVVIDSTSSIIYDIPVIEKTYYDGIDQSTFESQVLQTLVSSMDLSNYRMLTDFANIKFTKTKGTTTNMQYNSVTKTAVLGITETLPGSPSLGDRYIVSRGSNRNKIATCTQETAPITWSYTTPNIDDFVLVTDENKNYIYTGAEWVYPEYDIPIKITLEVFKTSPTIYNDDLIEDIKTALVTAFTTRFGPHATLFKSEIVDVVQGVTGVEHCHVIEPTSNIFFDNIDIDTFTQTQLLEYTPEQIYFTADDITVNVVG